MKYEAVIDRMTLDQMAIVNVDPLKCFFVGLDEYAGQPGFNELGVPGGEAVIEPINTLTTAFQEAGIENVYTQEAHPDDRVEPYQRTAHFAAIGEEPNFINVWPDHGRAGTPGADLHPALLIAQDPTLTRRFIKGDVVAATPEDDTSYTGALAHDPVTGELLPDYLRRKGKKFLTIVGLALGDGEENMLCVDSTATDFKKQGFDVTVVTDAVEAVLPPNREKCLRNMGNMGIRLATTAEVLAVVKQLQAA